MDEIEKKSTCECGTVDENKKKLLEVIASCEGDKSQLMKVLNAAQEIYGYIPVSAQKLISEELKIPMAEIYGVITFYTRFSLQPKDVRYKARRSSEAVPRELSWQPPPHVLLAPTL